MHRFSTSPTASYATEQRDIVSGKPCREDDGLTGPSGVFASLNDMIAWDAALRMNTLVSLDVLFGAMTPVGYGLGWKAHDPSRRPNDGA